ncbi:MAG: glycosyltransferase family 4 protein [Chlorobi bacterium]|nr:glycosyltransferase family 4 protein [Chlorobiota bacterium]
MGDPRKDSRCWKFARSLRGLGEVTIVGAGVAREDFNMDGIAVSQVPAFSRESFPAAWLSFYAGARMAASRLDADVYIASDLYSLPAAVAAGRRKIVWYDSRELYSDLSTLQGKPLRRAFWRTVEKKYGRRARVVTTVNASIADILRGRFRRVDVIRNYPLPVRYERDEAFRKRCGVPPGRFLLLSQGGLQKGRGAFVILDALQSRVDASVVFLGDGPLKGEITAYAEILGMSERVSLLPAVPLRDLPACTASADVGLCVIENLGRSYYLSLPNKLFEYIMAGVPVVASDFPELGAVIQEEGVGLACDPGRPDSIRAAIDKLLDDRETYEKCRMACLSARDRFNWEREEKKLFRIAKEITGN